MANLIDYHIPEAIQIQVTKCGQEPSVASPVNDQLIEIGEDVAKIISSGSSSINNNNNNKICTFCVDPQITSFSILQSLVVRAFNLQCDFALYYLDRTTKKSNLISKDLDLHQAFCSSSHPFLDITLNVIDYSSALANLTSEWQLSKNINKYRNILSDWDVVTNSDIILAQTINKTNNFIFKQLEKIKEKAISTTNNSWQLAETIYQNIIADDDEIRDPPIDDVTFRSFQDSEGRIVSQRDLRIAVYRRGVDESLRRVIWKHLLNVYPEDYTGQQRIDFMKVRCQTYKQMRDMWQKFSTIDPDVIKLCNMVRKDVYRTDRHHPFYANCKTEPEEDDNQNVTALFNILITYALNHQNRYCQGMSDLASPLLYVMKDEAHAYVTFCALMSRLGENFNVNGQAISRKFEHLTALLKHYDPELYRHLYVNGAHELLFCYRWLLLDLKREFPFEETLEMLEVLWASIPPANFACKNLYDDGFVFSANRNLLDVDLLESSVAPKTVENVEKPIKATDVTIKTVTKPKNECLQNMKFCPTVLSNDTRSLNSPSDNEECENVEKLSRPSVTTSTSNCSTVQLIPWFSPDLTTRRKQFVFEHPSLGSSKCDQFGSSECCDVAVFNEETFEENGDEIVFSEYDKTNRTESTSKSQAGDDVSTCSTFDSGIQRSNTLSSMVQDESVQSINMNRIDLNEGDNVKAAEEAARRRQRFHCLNGLRNAHCNGDDFSDDEDAFDYDYSSTDDNDGYLTEFDCKASQLSGSSNSTGTMLCNGEDRRRSKPTLALSKKLLSVGKSFSIDSLTSSSFEKHDKLDVVPSAVVGPQISVDVESPVSEFEVKCASNSFPKMMAKSVSEEILNNMENTIGENMQMLSVGSNHDDANLDNFSSSSTSSLVILSKSTRKVSGIEKQDEMDQQLPTPDELGQNEAFMLFMCLTIMLQNRGRIIDSNMDRNDIQMFFDTMIRKHNVRNVLEDARHLFHTYLSQWHKECPHK